MIFSTQEVDESLPVTPTIQSQAKERAGAGALQNWRGKCDAKSKGNKWNFFTYQKGEEGQGQMPSGYHVG